MSNISVEVWSESAFLKIFNQLPIINLISKIKFDSDRRIEDLENLLSKELTNVLRDRIFKLKDVGLFGIFMKYDSHRVLNVGTALGFRDEDWEIIKKHSGLWDPMGRIQREEVWREKLPEILVARRISKRKNETHTYWIKFVKYNNINEPRKTRGSATIHIDDEDSSTPLDDTQESKIYELHENMESKGIFYAHFPYQLRCLARELEERQQEEKDDERISFKSKNAPEQTTLEKLFFSSTEDTQKQLVVSYLSKYKVL
jgi:hypothetical protein